MKNTIVQRLQNILINSGRTRARAHLLRMSDRALEDAGFSRLLLEQGNQAWPWRAGKTATSVSSMPIVAQRTASATRAERQAIEQLRRYSNAELADLGITRGEIEQVVKHGRIGIERTDYPSAA